MKSHRRTVSPKDGITVIIGTMPHSQFDTFFKPPVEILSLIKFSLYTNLHLRHNFFNHWPGIIVNVTIEH